MTKANSYCYKQLYRGVFTLINFLKYNWQVRDEWFEWCNQLSNEELIKERTGGVGSILYTLFHIIDVEYSWVRGIQGKEDIVVEFADYDTLERVKSLSDRFRNEIAEFLKKNLDELKEKAVCVAWDEDKYTVEEILHHIIAHEIHHIGQLSVWSREIELNPVPANFIGRKFKSIHSY
ncbi:damage-inducible protein DinB [Bacillus thuringiensis]|nr:damage-inducible protein DinB [Bacillus thuringiensis]